jgi:hypothetical protein
MPGKYVSPSSAVHAGFEKFCIPMGVHGKKEFSQAAAVFSYSSTASPPGRTAQNAGCMMATHANCTKSKNPKIYNLLIYNDIL